jgi:hypothetical protein
MKVYRDLLQADPHNEVIRQKLVDLKHRIEASKSAPAADPPAAPNSTIVDVPAPAAEAEEASAADVRGAETPQTVEILTRWLDSISTRRADVR